MKKNYKYILPVVALGFVAGSPCFAGGPGAGTMPLETENASQQPPVVAKQAVVPNTYVWDGYENVGYVNNQAYYLGEDNIWRPLATDPTRQEHFNDWQRMNPDWQSHAMKNVKYDKVEGQFDQAQLQVQGQVINRQDQYRNSPINRTDQNGPPVRAIDDHNGPPQ